MCLRPCRGRKSLGSPARFLIRFTGRLISVLCFPPRPGNTKGDVIPGVIFQNFPGRLVQGYGLIFAALGVVPDSG